MVFHYDASSTSIEDVENAKHSVILQEVAKHISSFQCLLVIPVFEGVAEHFVIPNTPRHSCESRNLDVGSTGFLSLFSQG